MNLFYLVILSFIPVLVLFQSCHRDPFAPKNQGAIISSESNETPGSEDARDSHIGDSQVGESTDTSVEDNNNGDSSDYSGSDGGSHTGQDKKDKPSPLPEIQGQEYFVLEGASGKGQATNPFGSIQKALDIVQPGDRVTLLPGTYIESLKTRTNGTADLPIVIHAKNGRGSVTLKPTTNNRLLEVQHSDYVFSDLTFDGVYYPTDTIRVRTGGHRFHLRNSEVLRSGRDCIDMGGPVGVVIEFTKVHHCLWYAGDREDAHGIVAGPVRDLLIRNVEVHSFSGDAFQIDPGREAPGWDNVHIENSHFWLQPLKQDENGFSKGAVPGENAVDTKVFKSGPRPRLAIQNTLAHGFRDGLIANMSAFNIKEQVDAQLHQVIVYDSEIAFRLRNPARVLLTNILVFNTQNAVRYEDGIQEVSIYHATFGAGIRQFFVAAPSRDQRVLDIKNSLFFADSLPDEAYSSATNLTAKPDDFVNLSTHDYHLSLGSVAIDQGQSIPHIDFDLDGRKRNTPPDVGTYESLENTL